MLESGCSIVLQEGRSRQIIYTLIVSWCSVTIGMCLEGSWRTNDAGTEYDKNKLSEMSKTLLYIGAIVSAGPAAFIASMQNKLREVLIIGMWFTLGGSILITFSTDALRTLIFGRIFHGIGAGIVCVIVPNYASEFTDSQYRDVLIGLHHVHLISGMILSQIADEYLPCSYVHLVSVVMAIINLMVLCYIEDPPYYQLIFWANLQNCVPELKFKISSSHFHKVLKNREIDKKIYILSSIFTKKQYYRPLLFNICLISIQQFSGNVSLMYKLQCVYGTILLSEMISTVTGTLVLQLISSIICLLTISFMGKKNILIISGLGMMIALFLVNATYYMKSIDDSWLPNLIFIYIIFYSIGYGPMPWILMPQICTRKSKLWTSAVTVSVYAFLSLIINQPFIESIKDIFGVDIFLLIVTIVSAIGVIFAFLFCSYQK